MIPSTVERVPRHTAEDVNERVEVGQHALVQALAKDIVAELRSNW